MTLVLAVPVMVVLAVAGVPMIGPALGVGIGVLLVVPQRRLLKELGLTNVEAKQLLAAEQERRARVARTAEEHRRARAARKPEGQERSQS